MWFLDLQVAFAYSPNYGLIFTSLEQIVDASDSDSGWLKPSFPSLLLINISQLKNDYRPNRWKIGLYYSTK